MRLIDADLMIANGFKDKTIEVRTEDIIKSHEKVVELLFRDAVDFINKQPTVDAVERKRGEWINDKGLYRCSACNELWVGWWAVVVPIERMNKEMRFCPNCGAEMGGEANKDD